MTGRGAREGVEHSAVILVYHRVADADADPFGLRVSPANFDAQLAALRRIARPVTLEEVVGPEGPPPRAVAVTFDDGYADNLHNAAPLLVRHRVPATVFVTSGFLDDPREPWEDALERALLRPGTLPRRLRIRAGDEEHEWSLGEGARLGEEERRRWSGWCAYDDDPPTPRHRLFRELWMLLRRLAQEQRRGAVDHLLRWSGAPALTAPESRMLTREELRALGGFEGIEIGAHTVTHPVLRALPPARQRAEILDSRDALSEVLARPIRLFAYPFGSADDYSRETVSIAREAGFLAACTTRADVYRPGTPVLELPRVMVWNWDADTFAGWLEGWFRAPTSPRPPGVPLR